MPKKWTDALRDANISTNRRKKSHKVFNDHISADFNTIPTMKPHEYVDYCWNRYTASPVTKTRALNGQMFELIIYTLLYREEILPFYRQAALSFIPNITYDVVLYHDDGTDNGNIIVLSLKTTGRERYKQADLEGAYLKNIHRRALNYFVSRADAETLNVQEKIDRKEILYIDRAVNAVDPEFDDLIEELKDFKLHNGFKSNEVVEVISKGSEVE